MVLALEGILISNGYNTNGGLKVDKALPSEAEEVLPMDRIAVWPGQEEREGDYASGRLVMPVAVEYIALLGYQNVVEAMEAALGDLIEALTGDVWVIDFTNGQNEPSVGDTLVGQTSTATGYIQSVGVSSGAWATNDAAGTFTFRRAVG
ncbi:unnamed protein product, partial [marine sediment metagenome]